MLLGTGRGTGKEEKFRWRGLLTLPLLGLVYAANIVLNMTEARVSPYFGKAIATYLIKVPFSTVSVRKMFKVLM